MPSIPRPKNQLDSFRYAVEGIVHAFRTQRHMRFHFFLLVLALLAGMIDGLSSVKLAILFVVVSSVLVAEMFNTAIESVVDMVTQAYHPLAKLAKDIAAGAVLITAVNAVIVGALLFFGDVQVTAMRILIRHDPQPLRVVLTIVVLVLIVALIGKSLGGKNSL